MTTPNKSFQSGHARAYVRQEWNFSGFKLYVSLGDNTVVVFDKGNLMLHGVQEGVVPSDDDIALAWSEAMEDTVVDMFKAIGKALDIYSDEPSQAYKQGYAEGESKVLREWNDSLRDPHWVINNAMAETKDEVSQDAMAKYKKVYEQGTLFPTVSIP